MTRRQWFLKGMKAGIPICMGYFAVAIALGIAAKSAGIASWQAALTSFLINASAGEYIGFTLMISWVCPNCNNSAYTEKAGGKSSGFAYNQFNTSWWKLGLFC
jgi:hypothetical protein